MLLLHTCGSFPVRRVSPFLQNTFLFFFMIVRNKMQSEGRGIDLFFGGLWSAAAPSLCLRIFEKAHITKKSELDSVKWKSQRPGRVLYVFTQPCGAEFDCRSCLEKSLLVYFIFAFETSSSRWYDRSADRQLTRLFSELRFSDGTILKCSVEWDGKAMSLWSSNDACGRLVSPLSSWCEL